ncbi:metal ABC transporter ATP-binding protein [bacterium 1XD42-8]|nr:metal ABC transporter ATP-binding protein [Lachnospiraceae bacterium]RKJ53996.1 metal ABC transporter ATP-binding protein [bacterium 1XD42-8]
MAYMSCKNLVLGYDGRAVTRDLTFEVNKGDYLCIVGENGAGKSTLIKTLLGLMEPLEGSITTDEGLKTYEIGYLPQQTVVQRDFPASVWEIVLSGTLAKCGRRPFYSRQEKKDAEENMKKMSIWELRKKCYRNLSGGQQQRVLLARALCATTKLLLLDEPVSGLDPKVTTEFYQLVEGLNKEGITIIMVSHDIHAAVQYANYILHINQKQFFFGEKEAYLKSEEWKLFQ